MVHEANSDAMAKSLPSLRRCPCMFFAWACATLGSSDFQVPEVMYAYSGEGNGTCVAVMYSVKRPRETYRLFGFTSASIEH
jgi:hypothetical protein